MNLIRLFQRKQLGILLFCLLLSFKGFAQNQNTFYSFHLGYAKVLKSYSAMPETNISIISAFEFGKSTDGSQVWHSKLNFPQYGVEIMFGRLNNDFLGDVYGIQPFLRLFLNNSNKVFRVSISGGMGFSYFNNPFHPVNNPENALIGSHITNYSKAQIELVYPYKNLRFFASIGAFHFSNGHVSLPNIGANVPEMKLGILYCNDVVNPEKRQDYQKETFTWQYDVSLGIGFHEYGSTVKPYGGPIYPVYTFSNALSKEINSIYRLGFGFNVGHYTSFYRFVENELSNEANSLKQSMYSSVIIAQELMMGRVSLYGEFGVDVYKAFLRNYADIFNHETGFSAQIKLWNSNRLGLRYYFDAKKSISSGIYIKANFAQADFAEMSINYRFGGK
jgi:hypothetical protein